MQIKIEIQQQILMLSNANEKPLVSYPIASARNGIGQIQGSECTPWGQHKIAEKMGDEAVVNTVFVGRQATGEIYSEALASNQPQRDWILTRILWLEGTQKGINQGCDAEGRNCDSKQRYIYIHGCPDSHAMQIPSSHGCIKMRNIDMIDLFDRVNIGDRVTIR